MFNFLNKKQKNKEIKENIVNHNNNKTKLSNQITKMFNNSNNKQLPLWQKMFNGAKQSDSFSDWNPTLRVGNSHTQENFELLVARSRDLYQNNPLIKKYVTMSNQNIVGDSGFVLQTLSQEKIKNEIIEKRWKKFCEKGNFEVTKKLSFIDFLEVSVKNTKIDGEVLFLNIIEDGQYKIQLIDSMRINNNYNGVNSDNNNNIVGGVEINDKGEIEALWVHDFSDQAYLKNNFIKTTKNIRLSKEVFNFIFKQENAEQLRGYPAIANVMHKVKDLDEFKEQTLKAARIGVAYNMYLQQTEADAPPLSVFAEDAINEEETTQEEIENGVSSNDSLFHEKLGHTEIMSMPKGYEIKGFQGQYPDAVFTPFNKTSIQEIAAGLNVSPLFLGNDTSDFNYATSKVILNEEQIAWKKEQRFIIDNICSIIYKNWLKQELLNKIDYLDENNNIKTLTINDYNELSEHKFYGRSWPNIDPLKELDAQEKLLTHNLTSKTKICAENGYSFEEILQEISKEKELEKQYLKKDDNVDNANNKE